MVENKGIYINRELSWLNFNARVLEEAEDASLPLLERLKFVSIFGTNLDEFFMVRLGKLHDRAILTPTLRDNKTNLTAREQTDAVCAALPPLLRRKEKVYAQILESLADQGVRKLDFKKISAAQDSLLEEYFKNEILGLLSPRLVSEKLAFPFLQNRATYLAVRLKAKSDELKVGLVAADDVERLHFVRLNGDIYYVLAEEILYHFAPLAFSGYTVAERYLIRVTRNADINILETHFGEDMTWRDTMCEVLRRRKSLAAVRLQVNKPLRTQMHKYLTKNLNLRKNQIFTEPAVFDATYAFRLENILRKNHPELLFAPQQPLYSPEVDRNVPLHLQAQKKDLLFCYPFQSIRPFERLLEEAAADPETVSIKITLYRVAANSQIMASLLKAVENGVAVTVMLELRARFDEQNNIDWSHKLEAAGCKVLYGLEAHKVHSKILLIERKGEDGYSYTAQIGTGNYNEKTAEQYTDLSLITANRALAVEIKSIFDQISVGETVEGRDRLLVAPHCMLPPLLEKIDAQIERARNGEEAQIIIKCNSVSNKPLIDRLLAASQAGVRVRLFVRGICCFKAGVPGVSENITVKSIVGRYLEHSRIYVFGTGEDCEVYLSSADFMTRNMENRVEVAAPILDKDAKQTILEMLEVMDRDNVKARVMLPDGSYVRFKNDAPPLDSQMYFFEKFGGQPASVLPVKTEEAQTVDIESADEPAVEEEVQEETPAVTEKKLRPMLEDAERALLVADLADLKAAKTETKKPKKRMPLWAKILIGLLIGGGVCTAAIYYVTLHLGWTFWSI